VTLIWSNTTFRNLIVNQTATSFIFSFDLIPTQLSPNADIKTIDVSLHWQSTSATSIFIPYPDPITTPILQPRKYEVHQPISLVANHPYVAHDDLFEIWEDQSIFCDVISNDFAVIPTINQVFSPNASTVSLHNPQTLQVIVITNSSSSESIIRYTPTAGFVGTVSFSYSVLSSTSPPFSSSAIVTIVVKPNLHGPIASPDEVSTCPGCSMYIDALANDADVDGNLDPSSLIAISSPQFGSLTLIQLGMKPTISTRIDLRLMFLYNASSEAAGLDTFTYRVCDLSGLCDYSTVFVTFSFLDLLTPPLAVNDAFSTFRNTSIVMEVLVNDIFFSPPSLSSSLLLHPVVQIEIFDDPHHGNATMIPSNNVSSTLLPLLLIPLLSASIS
jgi:hypothetical protein